MFQRFVASVVGAVIFSGCGGSVPGSNSPAGSGLKLVLTVQIAGDGSGSVLATGLTCMGSSCSGTYPQGTSVELTATAGPDSFFSGWSGKCTGTDACTLTMSSGASIVATFNRKVEPLQVALRLDGGGAASVSSDPAGLTCSQSACSGSFPYGSTVTLTPVDGTARFVRWMEPCAVSGTACQVNMVTGNSVTAVFLGANYVFATSTAVTASNLPLSSADAECNARAAVGGLPGHYVAWLSTSTVNAASRLGAARGWVNHDGRPFADSVDDLSSGEVFYPIELDENGSQLHRPDVVTGTRPDGTLETSQNCSDWSTASSTVGVLLGRASAGSIGWTAFEGTICSPGPELHLYCFGIDATTPLEISRVQGRIAFISKTQWAGNGGVVAMDGVCAAEATAAGLSGSFKALVASSTASAINRFDLTRAPWVRVDGIPISATANDLAAGNLTAPIDVFADSTYPTGSMTLAWTGAPAPTVAGTRAATCNDWTDNSTSAQGQVGIFDATTLPLDVYESAQLAFFSSFIETCNQPRNIYCLQE